MSMNEGITALASLLNLYENSADPFASIKSQVGSRRIRVEKIVTSSTKYQVIQKNGLLEENGGKASRKSFLSC